MVERLAIQLIEKFIEKEMIGEKQKEEYVYALVCEMELGITIGSILLIAISNHKLLPSICFLFSFFSLRKRTGGYHLNSFLGCYIGTLSIYGMVVYGCGHIEKVTDYIEVMLIMASVYIAIIGMVNHPNMQMNFQEIQETKKAARLILLMELFVIAIMRWLNVSAIIVNYFMMGIIVCAILLGVAKITGQEVRVNE